MRIYLFFFPSNADWVFCIYQDAARYIVKIITIHIVKHFFIITPNKSTTAIFFSPNWVLTGQSGISQSRSDSFTGMDSNQVQLSAMDPRFSTSTARRYLESVNMHSGSYFPSTKTHMIAFFSTLWGIAKQCSCKRMPLLDWLPCKRQPIACQVALCLWIWAPHALNALRKNLRTGTFSNNNLELRSTNKFVNRWPLHVLLHFYLMGYVETFRKGFYSIWHTSVLNTAECNDLCFSWKTLKTGNQGLMCGESRSHDTNRKRYNLLCKCNPHC